MTPAGSFELHGTPQLNFGAKAPERLRHQGTSVEADRPQSDPGSGSKDGLATWGESIYQPKWNVSPPFRGDLRPTSGHVTHAHRNDTA